MKIMFSKQIYEKEALLKAAYLFLEQAYILLDDSEEQFIVEITEKEGIKVSNLVMEFQNELLAQTVRRTVYRETKDIRRLLTARAMASTIVDTKNEIESSTKAKNESLDYILKDWFEKNEE